MRRSIYPPLFTSLSGDSYYYCTYRSPVLNKNENIINRVLKYDVIKIKFLKLWEICEDILKEQCPRDLLAENEHFGANCL